MRHRPVTLFDPGREAEERDGVYTAKATHIQVSK